MKQYHVYVKTNLYLFIHSFIVDIVIITNYDYDLMINSMNKRKGPAHTSREEEDEQHDHQIYEMRMRMKRKAHSGLVQRLGFVAPQIVGTRDPVSRYDLNDLLV